MYIIVTSFCHRRSKHISGNCQVYPHGPMGVTYLPEMFGHPKWQMLFAFIKWCKNGNLDLRCSEFPANSIQSVMGLWWIWAKTQLCFSYLVFSLDICDGCLCLRRIIHHSLVLLFFIALWRLIGYSSNISLQRNCTPLRAQPCMCLLLVTKFRCLLSREMFCF